MRKKAAEEKALYVWPLLPQALNVIRRGGEAGSFVSLTEVMRLREGMCLRTETEKMVSLSLVLTISPWASF